MVISEMKDSLVSFVSGPFYFWSDEKKGGREEKEWV